MNKLNILWTSDNLLTAHNMVFMYGINGKKMGWWDEVNIIIWGASAKLAAEDTTIQEKIKLALFNGVEVTACLACAANLGAVDTLKELGVDVKYYGAPLTEILKSGEKIITI